MSTFECNLCKEKAYIGLREGDQICKKQAKLIVAVER